MAVQAYLILLYFTLLSFVNGGFLFFVYKFKVCGNPVSSKSIGAIFPTAFAHFMSFLSHIGNSCNILVILATFQTF